MSDFVQDCVTDRGLAIGSREWLREHDLLRNRPDSLPVHLEGFDHAGAETTLGAIELKCQMAQTVLVHELPGETGCFMGVHRVIVVEQRKSVKGVDVIRRR